MAEKLTNPSLPSYSRAHVTQKYIDELVSTYPSTREVRLFGSRADERFLHMLLRDARFNVRDID